MNCPCLKRCFSYCAVYPKDTYIYAEGLIEEWMALGYLGSVTRKNGVVEIKGRDYFNSLAMRSLFQNIKKSDDGLIESCKLHDIVHDFALFLRKNDDNLQPKSSCQVCSSLLVSRVQKYRNLVWGKGSPMNVCDCLASARVLRFNCRSLSVNGLPRGMIKLIHLRWLDLSCNDLSEEDLKIICMLYFLQTLLLEECSLEEIPTEIGKLVELRYLGLSHNGKLKELPSEIGKLVELRRLDLSHNEELKELPSEIGKLVELRRLNLSHNEELKEFPSEIGNLVELRYLNLSENRQLKELSSEIGNLVQLRILYLYHCENLQVLPEGIHKLQNLQKLLIAVTPASRCLPRGLGELSGLRMLGTDFYGRRGWNKLGLLKKLNSLTGFLNLVIEIPNNNTSDFEELVKDAGEADLRSKIHIHKLLIYFNKDEEVEGSLSLSSSLWMELMEALQPNLQKLKQLAICGYMGSRLPEWISSPFSSLKKIYLGNGCYEPWTFPPLGRLPSLEFLRIMGMEESKCLGRELLGIDSLSPSSSSTTAKGVIAFHKLEELHISDCLVLSEWEDITEEEEESAAVSIMPCLEKLPDRLLRKASSSLQILKIESSSLLKSQYENKEGSEWRSISQYNPQLELLLNDADDVDSDDD